MGNVRDAGLKAGVPVVPKDGCLNVKEIMDILPHRYPFLMVDKIVEFEVAKRAVGIKNVTVNEPFFTGHFPGKPIMPGVMILEAMAQVGGILLFSVKDSSQYTAYFVGLNNVKFRVPVVPGDVLRMELNVTNMRSRIAVLHGVAYVGPDIVAEGDIMFGFAK